MIDLKNITLYVYKDLQWIDIQDISKVDWVPAEIEVLDNLFRFYKENINFQYNVYMNIYVDETFLGDKTIIAAVKISNKKIKEAIYKIKSLHSCPPYKIIKATDIRRNANKGKINKTVKIIESCSKRTEIKIIHARQHTPKFFSGYREFVESLSNNCPSANIYVDNFGGAHQIQTKKSIKLVRSAENVGIQLADIFLVDKRI